jgi:hypothetical protein
MTEPVRTDDPFAIPELTRALRAFAAPSALGGLHDRYFAPLLDARRAATRVTRWLGRLTAFDAERLEATMRVTLQTFAAERHPRAAPERRALAARLDDACGELFDALVVLGTAQSAVRDAADDDVRAGLWTDWVRDLTRVYAAADRGWENARGLLGAAPESARKGARRGRKG